MVFFLSILSKSQRGEDHPYAPSPSPPANAKWAGMIAHADKNYSKNCSGFYSIFTTIHLALHHGE